MTVDDRAGDPAPPVFCPVCRLESPQYMPGPGGRPRARCTHCHSLERHRLLAVLLRAYGDQLEMAGRLLEVAPQVSVTQMLKSASPGRYVGVDIDPAAGGRTVDVIGDLCSAPFVDGVFDIAVCFHVLEHIPDDLAAMAELARILTPRGIAFVQVPWRQGSVTDEDPSAGPEERLARFGQADHVRWYGDDFEDRLRHQGLHSVRIKASAIVSAELIDAFGLVDRTPVWIVGRTGSELAGSTEAALVERIRRSLPAPTVDGWRIDPEMRRRVRLAEIRTRDAEQRATAAEQRAARAEDAYRRLRNRWPIRIAAALRDGVRRITPRRRRS